MANGEQVLWALVQLLQPEPPEGDFLLDALHRSGVADWPTEEDRQEIADASAAVEWIDSALSTYIPDDLSRSRLWHRLEERYIWRLGVDHAAAEILFLLGLPPDLKPAAATLFLFLSPRRTEIGAALESWHELDPEMDGDFGSGTVGDGTPDAEDALDAPFSWPDADEPNSEGIDLEPTGPLSDSRRQSGLMNLRVAREERYVIDGFYATTRNLEGESPKGPSFGDEFADVSYGSLRVTLPRSRAPGQIPRPRWWKLERRERQDRHVVMEHVASLPAGNFFRQVAERALSGSDEGSPEILLYIHGYNESFESAAWTLGQLAFDLKFPGAAVLFSWPSKNSLLAYTYDLNNANRSRPALEKLIVDLHELTTVATIHIVAHSMGNHLLAEVLDRLSSNHRQVTQALGHIVFAAPDVDRVVFRHIMQRIVGHARRYTLYASSRDRALSASRLANGDSRAGDTRDGLVIMPGLDSIDASLAGLDFLRHSYIVNDRRLLNDLHELIRLNIPPDERFNLFREPPMIHWRFQ